MGKEISEKMGRKNQFFFSGNIRELFLKNKSGNFSRRSRKYFSPEKISELYSRKID
jgi:hypothetical protein